MAEHDRCGSTCWWVGAIVALALLAIGYLIFSANGTQPLPKPVVSAEQAAFMTECIMFNTYDTCESRWFKLETAIARDVVK